MCGDRIHQEYLGQMDSQEASLGLVNSDLGKRLCLLRVGTLVGATL